MLYLSIQMSKERLIDYQVHTAEIGKDKISFPLCLNTNLML